MERRETDNITVVALQMDVSQTETEKLLDKGQMTERLNASAQTTEKLNAGENI